jgi:hypothetical protein
MDVVTARIKEHLDKVGEVQQFAPCGPDSRRQITHHQVNARNKLAGPPFIKPFPICTYKAVPIVPPIP